MVLPNIVSLENKVSMNHLKETLEREDAEKGFWGFEGLIPCYVVFDIYQYHIQKNSLYAFRNYLS